MLQRARLQLCGGPVATEAVRGRAGWLARAMTPLTCVLEVLGSTLLTEGFRGISQSLKLGHNCFLPHPFQFIFR